MCLAIIPDAGVPVDMCDLFGLAEVIAGDLKEDSPPKLSPSGKSYWPEVIPVRAVFIPFCAASSWNP